jgi:hypothetical protein
LETKRPESYYKKMAKGTKEEQNCSTLDSLEHEISYRIQNLAEGLSNSMMDVPLKDLEE